MKKTKLLTSVAALALVLSLGACNQPEDDSTGSEETSSETSSSSSSTTTEPETVTLTNYTLSITLKDEAGEPVAIPFYDSVYICGSWDSWAEWTVLTDIGDETESVLTTTFASIEEGTYEFKGVVGGQDDAPSWNLTEFIVSSTGGNVSFEVNAEDGDNYTNNLEFTVDATKVPVLEETPMTEAEIITAILATAEKADDEGLGWAAFKGVETDSTYDEEVNAYLTTDDNDNLYGAVFDYEDDELSFEYYYVDGVEYSHGLTYDNYFTEDDPEDFECGSNLEDALEWYLDGFEPFPYLSYEDREDWVLGHEEGSSIYTLAIPGYYTDTLTLRRAGDDFEIIAVSEVADGEEVSAELITAADVEAQMGGFNINNWCEDNYFNSVIASVAEDHNYFAETLYYIYQSDAVPVSYQGSVSLSMVAAYGYDFYATEDACLIEYLIYTTGSSGTGWYYYDVELYVNDYTNGLTEVYYLNGNSIYDLALVGYYYGTWEDNIGNLGNLMDYRYAFTVSSSYFGIEDYDVDSSAYEALMNATIANTYFWDSMFYEEGYGYYGMNEFMNGPEDFWYAEADKYGIQGYGSYIEFGFDSDAAWYYTDSTYQYIFAQETRAYTDISDVGTTEIDSNFASYLN